MFVNNNTKEFRDKLTILYILKKMEIPLTKEQLTDFILHMDIMDFFTISQYLIELTEINFIQYLDSVDPEIYLIGTNGSQALSIFKERLPTSFCEKIDIQINKYKVKYAKSRELDAEYKLKKDSNNEFIISLMLKDSGEPLLNLELVVFSQATAKQICTNWKNDAPAYYTKIIEILSTDI